MATHKGTPLGRGTRVLKELRLAALARGDTRFDPGLPCKRGHTAPCMTANGACTECMRERRPTYRLDPEKKRATQRRADQKRTGTPERRAKERARRAANPGRYKAQKLAWRQAHPERWKQTANARAKRWRDKNREAQCVFSARRRAKRRAAGSGCPRSRLAYERWARTVPRVACYWCKATTLRGGRHVDHIIPLSRGGSDAVGNLCVACPHCNQSKSAKLPHEFAGQSELALA